MNEKTIRIATRSSPLAMWQAELVASCLQKKSFKTEIIKIETSGDSHLTQPIYSMGISGVFTKQLDIALLNNIADIAVHSLKDVPTSLPKGLIISATLARASYEDVLIYKDKSKFLDNLSSAKIASGSLRRKAQWLSKYKNHEIIPIRGNVQTRIKKFMDNNQLDAIIFAKAGLERMDILPEKHILLDWMLPAAAQGIIGIACREDDILIKNICSEINHSETFICAKFERDFLKYLMGGCSVPIGVLAKFNQGKINLQGGIYDYDGQNHVLIEKNFEINEVNAGEILATEILKNNLAEKLIQKIRSFDLKKQDYDND
jgi:hydroxymethylbilane synthase